MAQARKDATRKALEVDTPVPSHRTRVGEAVQLQDAREKSEWLKKREDIAERQRRLRSSIGSPAATLQSSEAAHQAGEAFYEIGTGKPAASLSPGGSSRSPSEARSAESLAGGRMKPTRIEDLDDERKAQLARLFSPSGNLIGQASLGEPERSPIELCCLAGRSPVKKSPGGGIEGTTHAQEP